MVDKTKTISEEEAQITPISSTSESTSESQLPPITTDSKINEIEQKIKVNDIAKVETNDLLYYLQYASKNTELQPSNITNTTTYFQKIQKSYSYENIFINKANYTNIIISIIGLLISFFYYYPYLYNLGIIPIIVGIFSFFNLANVASTLYSSFFPKIFIIYIFFTVFIYVVFFIFLNGLNHISLFFISAVIAFVVLNYFFRVLILFPIKSNPYNKFRAKSKILKTNSEKYIPYNINIEAVSLEVIKRFQLKLPSGNMLYSYLTVFEINDTDLSAEIADFITNIIAPLLAVAVLYYLGRFLNNIELYRETTESGTIRQEVIKIIPVIGMSDESDESNKYLTCYANYILPKELNVELIILELIDTYSESYEDKDLSIIKKTLRRISGELLNKYKPLFHSINTKKNSN